jgi:hypothetical protein
MCCVCSWTGCAVAGAGDVAPNCLYFIYLMTDNLQQPIGSGALLQQVACSAALGSSNLPFFAFHGCKGGAVSVQCLLLCVA